MAAGLGFKDFTTGEVLTAADVDGYLMQGVWVFASAAARDAAVTSPQEGNFAYLKDTNVTTYYTGSAWANLDTTGMVNPMTTTGDTIYSSSGSTPARLGIGSTGDVLTVAAGVPTWAAPAAPPAPTTAYTLINTGGTTLSGSGTVTVSGISGKNSIMIAIDGASTTNTNSDIRIRLNTDSTTKYSIMGLKLDNTTVSPSGSFNSLDAFDVGRIGANNTYWLDATMILDGCNSTGVKPMTVASAIVITGTGTESLVRSGNYSGTSTISSVSVISSNGNFDAGTIYVYGA